MSESIDNTPALQSQVGTEDESDNLTRSEFETQETLQSMLGGETMDLVGNQRESVDVFISYRITSDGHLARALKRLIETAIDGSPVVFVADAGGITPSKVGFRGQLSAAARSAKVFVGIITQQSISREWIFFEAGAAWGRNALYAPLMFDVTPEQLPSTVGDYQATRATEAESVKLLIGEIAKQIGRAVRGRFVNRYQPFGKIAQTYPNDVDEEEKQDLRMLFECLSSGRYGDAERIKNRLLDEAGESDVERARIFVASIVFDRRLVDGDRIEKLEAIPLTLQQVSATFHFQRAKLESRDHVALRHYQACLRLQPNPIQRREALSKLAMGMYFHGDTVAAIEMLRELMRSASRNDRTTGAWALSQVRKEASQVTKFSLLTVAIGGSPNEQQFKAICEMSRTAGWDALSCYLSILYEQQTGDGVSAYYAGTALQNANLINLSYEAYGRAASRGVSVAKVVMASMLASRSIAAAGLEMLTAHEGSFDSSDQSFPFSVRAELEVSLHQERVKLDELLVQGRAQFQIWMECVGVALNGTQGSAVLNNLRIDEGSYSVGVFPDMLILNPLPPGEGAEIVLKCDDVPGLFYRADGDVVYLVVQDGDDWLSVVLRVDGGAGPAVKVCRTKA